MSLISIPFTFTVGAVIVAAQHNSNFSTIYSDYNGNIQDTNIASNAAISDSKLAQITTAGKVSGASFTSLTSIPSGAGLIPVANIDTGTTVNKIVILSAGTTAKLPAVDGSQLTGIANGIANAISILDYGTSASSSTQRGVSGSSLKIAYGATALSSGSITVSNLLFSSSTTYTVVVSLGTAPGTQSQGITVERNSGSGFTVTDSQGTNKIVQWFSIGT